MENILTLDELIKDMENRIKNNKLYLKNIFVEEFNEVIKLKDMTLRFKKKREILNSLTELDFYVSIGLNESKDKEVLNFRGFE